ncbi:MAG TPA: amidohydrolase family protein [Vicinamibacteria bacterium]|nr:amidohydrolase family protein [Vicinamibacteria bacterium]
MKSPLAAMIFTLSVPGLAQTKKNEGDKKLPLEPTRHIEFVTDEATWLSLDVSPDGERLVLEILGDLYLVPISGGEARPLTSGLAFDSQPRFSPDGEKIAFLSDRDGAENVWIMRSDGTEPKKLSQDEDAEFASPSWSADGNYVIASRTNWGQATYELWMYHLAGGAGVQITKAKPEPKTPRNQRHNALGAVASPDGRYLYYGRRQGGFQYNATFPLWQIARRDLSTGVEDILTQAQGSGVRPVLSPDGKKLVYGTRFDGETGLRIRDLEGGEDRWLIYPVQRDDQESAFTRDLLPGYAFTPDGAALVLSYGGRIHRVDIRTGRSTPVPFTAKVAQDLGPRLHFPRRVEEGPLRARLIQDPSLSPDGSRLAFSSLTRVYVMELPSGTPRAISEESALAFQPAWAPDGSTIAYVTWSGGEGHIWRVSADGGPPQRLTTSPAFYSDPVFSPGGDRIVALRASAYDRFSRPVDFDTPPGMDLVWLPSTGGETSLILPARGLGKPHFTHDPDRVFLYLSTNPFTSGEHGLISIRFDGTDRREHLKVTGPGIYFAEEPVGADDARMSPDGRWALVDVGNQLHLVAVTQVGGEALAVDITKPNVPERKLTDVGADYFAWADDGKTITWAIGSSFFTRPLESVSFTPAEEEAPFVPAEAEARVERIDVVIERERSAPSGTVVLRGARVITMREDEVLENADIVVSENRIVSVGPRRDPPEGAQVVDVSGATIVPGFVDTHAHWFEIRRGVLDVQNWSFLANLAYGVTAGLDVQTGTNDMFAYQDLVDAGVILGPRAYSTGPGIFSDNRFEKLEQARSVLSRYRDYYRTRNLKSYIVGNRRQRQLVVQAAKELEMMPTTEGALDLKLDITHALDGFSGNEHSLPIVPLYKDVVELFAQAGIGYTPTLLVAYGGPWAENYYYTSLDVHGDEKLHRFLPHNLIDDHTQRRPWFRKEEHIFPRIAESAAKIIRAGGRVGVGSHGQLQGLGYHWELWSLSSGGLSPLETLRAATLHGAEIIGLADDIGSIEPGKLADLVVLDKSPLEDIRNSNSVRLVMKNGELFEGATLDRIWPTPKKLDPLWWWDEAPTHPTRPGGEL